MDLEDASESFDSRLAAVNAKLQAVQVWEWAVCAWTPAQYRVCAQREKDVSDQLNQKTVRSARVRGARLQTRVYVGQAA